MATFDDVLELAQFARETFTAAYEKDMGRDAVQNHLEKHLLDEAFTTMMKKDVFYLATNDSILVGFVQIGTVDFLYKDYLENFDSTGSEIRRLYVLSSQQNQGIGSRLIEKSEEDPIVKRSKTTYLTTWESNYGAQRLYKRHRFDQVSQFPEYSEDGKLVGYEYIMAKSNI